jgi:hypothetical protein
MLNRFIFSTFSISFECVILNGIGLYCLAVSEEAENENYLRIKGIISYLLKTTIMPLKFGTSSSC